MSFRTCLLRLSAVVAALLFSTSPASAAFSYYGDITYATDYIFRGVSQTEQDAAVQGGYVFDTGFGLQFGTWGSNINFPSSNASLELDSYISFGFDLQNDLGIEVGVIDYHYPSAADLNFSELFLNLSILGVSLNIYTSDDYEATGASSVWTQIGYEFPLISRNLSLGLTYGQLDADESIFQEFNADGEMIKNEDNYSHWSLYFAFTLGDTEVRYSFSDANRAGCGENCDSLSTITWTRSF